MGPKREVYNVKVKTNNKHTPQRVTKDTMSIINFFKENIFTDLNKVAIVRRLIIKAAADTIVYLANNNMISDENVKKFYGIFYIKEGNN